MPGQDLPGIAVQGSGLGVERALPQSGGPACRIIRGCPAAAAGLLVGVKEGRAVLDAGQPGRVLEAAEADGSEPGDRGSGWRSRCPSRARRSGAAVPADSPGASRCVRSRGRWRGRTDDRGRLPPRGPATAVPGRRSSRRRGLRARATTLARHDPSRSRTGMEQGSAPAQGPGLVRPGGPAQPPTGQPARCPAAARRRPGRAPRRWRHSRPAAAGPPAARGTETQPSTVPGARPRTRPAATCWGRTLTTTSRPSARRSPFTVDR